MGKGYERTVRMRVVAKKEGGGDKVQGMHQACWKLGA